MGKKFFLLLSAAALTASADDIPFWGDASLATNRVCAAVASNTTPSDFDSRLSAYVEFFLDNFTTMPMGLLLLLQ